VVAEPVAIRVERGDAVRGFPIVPAVVVAERWDLSFYGSTDDIVREIAPWFPSDAEYRACDS
jgi:hypothetical protein